MQFKTRIACYGNRDIALDVARETILEAGFESLSGPKDEVQEFVNPATWNLSAQSPLRLSDRVSVRSAPDSLVLEGNIDGVPRRTMILWYAAGITGLLLIVANYMWAVHMQPLYKVLLPVAPWPLLVPLIHKNLNWVAQRQWNLTLRMIGRTAALRAAEQTVVEEPEEIEATAGAVETEAAAPMESEPEEMLV